MWRIGHDSQDRRKDLVRALLWEEREVDPKAVEKVASKPSALWARRLRRGKGE